MQTELPVLDNWYEPSLRESEFYLRTSSLGESSMTRQPPINEFDALMRTAPGETPEPTIAERQRLREAVADAMELLTEEERFIINAIHSERRSIRDLAVTLTLGKSQTQRLVKKAEEQLALHLATIPTIRERIHMDDAAIELSPPKTWNEAARRIVAGFTPTWDINGQASEKLIKHKVNQLRLAVLGGGVRNEDLCPIVRTVGQAATDILVELGVWDEAEMVDLLCRKQHDYGHDNINAFGAVGVAVRLSDKVARYFNLVGKQEAKAEPFIDSLLDMVGYAVIAQMLLDDTFLLNLEGE